MSSLINQTLLNQFRVDAFIASGGMGAVYRVWDIKRNVFLAMKVLHCELADDPHVFERFKREANALKKLTHPNIVQYYGLYQTLDIVFLLERFIDGPSLKDILRQQAGRPLSIQEALAYLKALSSALGYSHANGVVHCDVKPGNILIDKGGNIYLTDFGIARHAESTTTTIGTAGTAAYMAPEQIRGESVIPATDVYALGVMLFEILAGQRLFRGNEAGTEKSGDTANERIRYAHLHITPSNPRSINPSISQELAQMILRAMEKEPAKRFHSVREFLENIYAATGVSFAQVTDRVILPREFQETTSPRQSFTATQQRQPNQTSTSWKMTPCLIGGIAFVLIAISFVSLVGHRNTSEGTQLRTKNIIATEPSSSPIQQSRGTSSVFTPTVIVTESLGPTATLEASQVSTEPSGKIAFTCQIGRNIKSDQICIIDSDGSNFRQLTHNSFENYYPSLAPDGNSVLFASNQTGNFEIYEMDLRGNQLQLTSRSGELSAPEISPDGIQIVFTNNTNRLTRIWVMKRNGEDPYEVYSQNGQNSLDPVWSPDGSQILFATGRGENKRLYIINKDGSDIKQINSNTLTGGRSDWSPDGITIGTYSGEPWHREIYLFNLDGSNLRQISNGGNDLAPSFSPNGG